MYKKILALCLTVALVMSTTIMPIFADSPFKGNSGDKNNKNTNSVLDKKGNDKIKDILKHFTDSEDVDWAEKSIEKLGAMGIFLGSENGLFKPNSNVTHIEAIAMVLRLTGQEDEAKAIKAQPAFFKDVKANWTWGYLQLALNEGIIVPSEDGWFNPMTPAKRHEIAKYIVRALGERDEALKHMNEKLSFKDSSSIPKSSIGYVYVINELGIMQGSKNEFQPNKPITRAEMAVLLDRAENRFDDTVENDNALEGTFVSFDKANSRITLEINDKEVTYKVNPYAPVYRNNTYYLMETLEAGDVIEIVLDKDNVIIFIEFKEEGTSTPTTPSGQKLSIQRMQYSRLSEELQDKIDALKTSENYAAFKDGNYIYLVASMGRKSTAGYSIEINDVYKQTLQTGSFNLSAVVETENSSSSIASHDVIYPVDIIRFAYFEGINKVKFIDTDNDLLKETTIDGIDEDGVISGIIDSIDAGHKTIYVKESDKIVRPYYIPTSVKIYINDKASSFSALEENMTVEITRIDGVITRVDAEENDENAVIRGIINSIDDTHKTIYVKESDEIVRPYYIPTSVKIYINDRASNFSALEDDMDVKITKTNGVITKLEAEINDTVVINGKIASISVLNRTVTLLESDDHERLYTIPRDAQITLNNRAATLSSLAVGMKAAITKVDGEITKLAVENSTNSTEVINGKISSIDATNKLVYVKESDNEVRSYYIPTSVQITLNAKRVALSALSENMTVAITRTNGIITKLDATQLLETIKGSIDYVDVANSKIKLLESDNDINNYEIPDDAQILLGTEAADLEDVVKGMTAVITKVDGIVTKLVVQNDNQTITGVLISVYPTTNNSTIKVKVGTTYNNFIIIPETAVFYNDHSIAIQQMPLNTPISIKITNGIVVEVRNR